MRINLRHLKSGFSTYIYICVQNNFICYAFEDNINVGWGPHPALGLPVGQHYPRHTLPHRRPDRKMSAIFTNVRASCTLGSSTDWLKKELQ